MGKLIDLTGQRFCRLVVIALIEITVEGAIWLCECACGEMRRVNTKRLNRDDVTMCVSSA